MANIDYSRQHKSPVFPATTDDRAEAQEELTTAIGNSQEVLVRATTVFPFTLFPDTLTLDRAKLSVAHREFFKVGEVMSIRIEDVLSVTAHVGPLFGSIKIATRFFDMEKPYSINYFWREDALKIKRITQGYIIAMQQEIDCSSLSTKELAAMLDKLGESAGDSRV